MIPRLKEIINKEIQPALKDHFKFKNIYMVTKIDMNSQALIELYAVEADKMKSNP